MSTEGQLSANPVATAAVLAEIREAALSVDEVLSAVGDDGTGGTVVFCGTVRDHDEGRGVLALRYDAHPTAAAVMESVVRRVLAEPQVRAAGAVHRVGELAVGDIAVIVAVACAHREEAFVQARRLIDEIKSEVPIWKLQRFDDGAAEWVGSP